MVPWESEGSSDKPIIAIYNVWPVVPNLTVQASGSHLDVLLDRDRKRGVVRLWNRPQRNMKNDSNSDSSLAYIGDPVTNRDKCRRMLIRKYTQPFQEWSFHVGSAAPERAQTLIPQNL
jgi:hypothetical protein